MPQGFTRPQRRQLARRTTPSSRGRLANRFRRQNGKQGTVGAGRPQLAPQTQQATGPKPTTGQRSPAPEAGIPPKPRVGRPAQPDSTYHARIDTANREEAGRLGQLEGAEGSIRHEFGIDDPTNPFSRLEGLKKAFLTRTRATSANLAAMGQGYAGVHESALRRVRQADEQARHDLRRNYETAINDIGAQKAGVKWDTEEQKSQAFEDWLARAPESEDVVDPATPPPVTPTGLNRVGGNEPMPNNLSRLLGGAPKDEQIGTLVKGLPNPKGGGSRDSMATLPGDNSLKRGRRENREALLRRRLRQQKRAGNTRRVKILRRKIRRIND